MNFPAQLIPDVWHWGAGCLYLAVLCYALWRAHWVHLKTAQDAHIFFAAVLALWLLWRLSAGIMPGLEFHLLLVTGVTLMFGWPFAIVCVSLAQLLLTLEGLASWPSYALNVLCNGVIPVWFTYLSYRLIDRWLPHHLFVYLFGAAFFTGALSMLVSRLSGMALLLFSGAYESSQISSDYLGLLPIMMFPEAFSNGGLLTLLVVFRPAWVSSFNDDRYLRGK